MANVTFYPYGNANENQSSNGTYIYTCQHGENECNGNMVETCYINLVGFDQNLWVPFLEAFDYAFNHIGKKNALTVAQTVLSEGSYNVTYQQLSDCYYGANGNAYEHQMGLWTEAERKKGMRGTPWIVLNGVYDVKSSYLVVSYTLSLYTGCLIHDIFRANVKQIQLRVFVKHTLEQMHVVQTILKHKQVKSVYLMNKTHKKFI